MNGYLLDTHVWYWLLGALEGELRASDRAVMENASDNGQLFLSPMSVWETAQKESSSKLQMASSIEELLHQSLSDDSIRLVELTPSILIGANRLPGDIQGDPVDRILAATAREHQLVLLTRDTGFRRYAKQGHLRIHKV